MADRAIDLLCNRRARPLLGRADPNVTLRTGHTVSAVDRPGVLQCIDVQRPGVAGCLERTLGMTPQTIGVAHVRVVKDLACFVGRVALHTDRDNPLSLP